MSRTARTFWATAGELRDILDVLERARKSLLHELESEERKPIAVRSTEVEMDRVLARTVLFGRVTRELSS